MTCDNSLATLLRKSPVKV
uniref:Uncharacterized protein n=1 Tax=Arundo donax TaxID=35708 RepID=A0A0A8XZ18_ARUDO